MRTQTESTLDMLTEEVIKEMLLEPTGEHMMDSGGDTGRNWQKNLKEHPWDRPENDISLYGNQLEVTRNIYHFMMEDLTFAPLEDRKFTKWSNKKKNKLSSPGALQYDWVDKLNDSYKDHSSSGVDNSYNGLSLLGQVIQYVVYTKYDTTYCLVSIHQGADVRGGYGTPRVFKLHEEYLRTYHTHLGCSECECDWVYDSLDQTCLSFDDQELQDFTLRVNDEGLLICPECNLGVIS